MRKLATIYQGKGGRFYRLMEAQIQYPMYIGVAIKPPHNDCFENQIVVDITPAELAEMQEEEGRNK